MNDARFKPEYAQRPREIPAASNARRVFQPQRGRYRPYNKHNAGIVHAEDSQPNEAIDKRKQTAPPAVISSSSRGSRGRGPPAWGRGNTPQRGRGAHTKHRTFSPRRNSFQLPLKPFGVTYPNEYKPFSNEAVPTPQEPSSSSHTPPVSKRRKFSHSPSSVKAEDIDISLSHVSLVTYGSKWYHPLPPECLRSNPNWSANRQSWFTNESRILRSKGLKVTRNFFRDDGMVIDWSSPIPVHPDTLEPEPKPKPVPAPMPLEQQSSTSSDPVPTKKRRKKRKDPVPTFQNHYWDNVVVVPNPSLSPSPHPPSRHPSPGVTPAPEPEVIVLSDDDDDVEEIDEPQHHIPQSMFVAEIEHQTPPAMKELALDYLRRFIKAFDHDRERLRDAYTETSILSYSVVADKHPSLSTAHAFSGSQTYVLAIGRDAICKSLTSLGEFSFLSRTGKASFEGDYDVLYMEDDRTLVTLHTQVGDGKDHHVAVDITFLLTSAPSSDETGWPLRAISHQMVLRDQAWIPARFVTVPWAT